MTTAMNQINVPLSQTAQTTQIAPQFGAKYLVSGTEKELEQFRGRLRRRSLKARQPYSTATVKEKDEAGKVTRSLMVFTKQDATELKEAFKPQRQYNMLLSQYHDMRENYEKTLEDIHERLIRAKSDLIKEELGGDYFKWYPDFIQGLVTTSRGLQNSLEKELALFDEKFTPVASDSWKEFVDSALPALERFEAQNIAALETNTPEQNQEIRFDYKEGVMVNIQEEVEEKAPILEGIADKLQDVLTFKRVNELQDTVHQ